jgi:hyperosmotically inducible protein
MFKNKILISLISVFFMAVSGNIFANNETTGQYISSAAITADVKAKLLADSDIKSMHINVKTMKKNVILSGYVKTEEQKKKAESIAAAAEGVESVKNNLHVKND